MRKRKALSLALAVLVALSMLPAGVFADAEGGPEAALFSLENEDGAAVSEKGESAFGVEDFYYCEVEKGSTPLLTLLGEDAVGVRDVLSEPELSNEYAKAESENIRDFRAKAAEEIRKNLTEEDIEKDALAEFNRVYRTENFEATVKYILSNEKLGYKDYKGTLHEPDWDIYWDEWYEPAGDTPEERDNDFKIYQARNAVKGTVNGWLFGDYESLDDAVSALWGTLSYWDQLYVIEYEYERDENGNIIYDEWSGEPMMKYDDDTGEPIVKSKEAVGDMSFLHAKKLAEAGYADAESFRAGFDKYHMDMFGKLSEDLDWSGTASAEEGFAKKQELLFGQQLQFPTRHGNERAGGGISKGAQNRDLSQGKSLDG